MGSALPQRACTLHRVPLDRVDAVSLRESFAALSSRLSASFVNAAIIAGRKSALADLQLGYEQAASVITDVRELSAPGPIEATGRKAGMLTRHAGLARRGAALRDARGLDPVHAPILHSAASLNVVQHLYL